MSKTPAPIALEIHFVGPESFEEMANLWTRAQAARNVPTDDPARALEILQERARLADAWFAAGVLHGRIVAISHGLQARERDGEGDPISGLMHLSTIAVDPAYWRRGYGRKMTEFGIARGIEMGYQAVQLWTRPSNEPARRLYASLGFVATGRVKIDHGEPIGMYVLDLRSS